MLQFWYANMVGSDDKIIYFPSNLMREKKIQQKADDIIYFKKSYPPHTHTLEDLLVTS